MPVVAIGAAVFSAVGSAAVAAGGFLLSSMGSMAVSFGITALSSMLGKKKQNQAAQAFDQGIKLNNIDPAAPIPVVYGRRTVGGPVVFRDVGGNDNKYLYQAVVLSEGEIDSVQAVYFNEVPTAERIAIYDKAEPRSSDKFTYSGNFKTATGTDFKKAIADVKEKSLIELKSGGATQISSALLQASSKWSQEHIGAGVAYLAMRLEFDMDVFPNGIPTVTADVKGLKVYDPRNNSTQWSDNPALCIRDYLTNGVYGCGIDEDEIDDEAFVVAANYCDGEITVNSANGGQIIQRRYTCNGVINTDASCLENVNELLTCCRGMLIYSAGKYQLKIDKPEVATFAFNESNMLGDWSITGGKKRGVHNRIVSRFFSAYNKFNETLSVVVFDEDLENGNNEQHKKEMRYPFTSQPQRAAILSKINMKQSRQPWVVNFEASLEAFTVQVGDVVTITESTAGWDAKPFRIQDVTLKHTDTMQIVAQEYDSSVYTFDLDTPEAEVDTNLTTSFQSFPPLNFSVESGTEHLEVQKDGTILTRAFLHWEKNDKGYAVSFELGVKKTSDSQSTWSDITTGAFSHYFGPLIDGLQYDFRIRSVNANGVKSPYIYLTGQKIEGKLEPPNPPTDFSFSVGSDYSRRFSFNPSTDPDIAGYKIRFSKTSNVWENMTALHNGLITVSPYETSQLSGGFYYFAIKAVDTSKLESSPVTISATVITDENRSIFKAIYPHLDGWPGTLSGGYVSSTNIIYATDQKTWADFATTNELIYDLPHNPSQESLILALSVGSLYFELIDGALVYKLFGAEQADFSDETLLWSKTASQIKEESTFPTLFPDNEFSKIRYYIGEETEYVPEDADEFYLRLKVTKLTPWSEWTNWVQDGNTIVYKDVIDLGGVKTFIPLLNASGEGTISMNVGVSNSETDSAVTDPTGTPESPITGRYFGFKFTVDSDAAELKAATVLLDGNMFEEANEFSIGSDIAGTWKQDGVGAGFLTTGRNFVGITSVHAQVMSPDGSTNKKGTVTVISANPGNSITDQSEGVYLEVYDLSGNKTNNAKINVLVKGY